MMKKWQKMPLAPIIAIVLGIILTLAFAPYSIFPFAIISLAGLLALLANTSGKRAFFLGWLFGIGLFGAGIPWVFHSIHVFGGMPSLGALFVTGGLVAILALFPATVCGLANRFFAHNLTTKNVYAFPAIWIFGEWFRSLLFTGFPWLLVGYSQTNSPLAGFAPFFSVYGVSLAVLVCAGLTVNTIFAYFQQNYRFIYYNLLILIGIFSIGGFLHHIAWTEKSGQPLSVSLVQGNIPQSLKWDPEHIQLSLDRYVELTNPLWGKDHIIIWPEAAIPLSLQDAAPFVQALDDKATATGSHLILGIPIQTQHPNGYYNSIVTLGKDKQVYNKRLLVPFGEYTPALPFLTQLANAMNIPMANMIAGNVMQNALSINNIKILPSICYEIAFPQLMRTNDKTTGVLLTLTNDAWFGESAAQAQHLQMAQMRAQELQKPVIFVSNDGITAIIGPSGKIEKSAPPHEPYVLTGKVQPMMGVTPWMQNGMTPLFITLIGFLFNARRANKKALKLKLQTEISH